MLLHEVELGRVCVWAAELDLQADHAALEADIGDLIDSGRRNSDAPGDQTLTELHQRDEPHWRRLFAAFKAAIVSLAEQTPTRLDEGTVHLRSWATRVAPRQAAPLGFQPQDLHNHSPAFLSGVYFVRHEDLGSEADAGTYFANPFPHSLISPAPGLVMPGKEGRLVLFPSWVLHGPRLSEAAVAETPRVMVAFDAHLIPH